MGIKNLSSILPKGKQIDLEDLTGTTVAIDAMEQIHRHLYGTRFLNLTDEDGQETAYINVIFMSILRNMRLGIDQIWVFDSSEANIHKAKEHEKRKAIKEKMQQLIEDSKSLSDIDSASYSARLQRNVTETVGRIVNVDSTHIKNVKFILDCLSIVYVDAPTGYEAEQIAAALTYDDSPIKCDHIMSSDMDALLFGARSVVRYHTQDKTYTMHRLDEALQFLDRAVDGVIDKIAAMKNPKTTLVKILGVNYAAGESIRDQLRRHYANINIHDLIAIGLHLGCDFAEKSAGVGAKTLLKMFRSLELTHEQKSARDNMFEKLLGNRDILHELRWHNIGMNIADENVESLIDWLAEKKFNEDRVRSLIEKSISTHYTNH